MSRPNSRLIVGENHRRAIAAALSVLDETLCRFQRWALGEETDSVLFRERNDLSHHQRQSILEEVKAVRQVLETVRDDFGLEPRRAEVSCAILAQASVIWETLVELGSKHIRRYGDISPDLARYVDDKTKVLIEHVERMVDIAGTMRE